MMRNTNIYDTDKSKYNKTEIGCLIIQRSDYYKSDDYWMCIEYTNKSQIKLPNQIYHGNLRYLINLRANDIGVTFVCVCFLYIAILDQTILVSFNILI